MRSLISGTRTGELTWIRLATPTTPVRLCAAFSASVFWKRQATSPVSVTTPFSTLTPIRSAGKPTRHLRISTARLAISLSAVFLSDGSRISMSCAIALTPLTRRAARFGRQFIGVARDETRQGDDAVMHADADIGGIDPRLEIELVEYVLPQLVVVDHAILHEIRAGMLTGLQQRRF